MDDAFRTEMAAGYTFDEPVVVLGSPILGDEVLPDVRVQVPLSRVNRHGLIAGATGTGKTKTLQLLAGQLSARSASRCSPSTSRATCRASARPATRPTRRSSSRGRVDRSWTFEPPGPPDRDPVAVGQAGRARPGERLVVRAAAAGQGPRPQRHPDLDPVARLPLLRRPGPAAARPRGPADDAQVPRLGRGQAGARGPGRHQPGVASGVILRAIVTIEQEGAGDLLRRARVRRRRPAPDDAPTARGS